MIFLRILMFLFIAAGFGIVLAAKAIVKRFKINEKTICHFEHEMTEEELERYKFNKAVLNVKMMGMLIALPGLILLLVIYK
ncbi:MAG: hypothetical protein GX383_13135 [Clostridium sp.]|nr:hypothetical protein [Clostridium sp.]